MQTCLEELNHPEKNFKCVHVAGTNGKGSTCAMIERSLREAGYITGLYTSPHLVKPNERIQIKGKMISDSEFESIYNELLPVIEKHSLSFFESITVIAFVYFSKNKVEIAVLEVGMGGRLDATNVVIPSVSVITDIGFDHMKHLGNTISKIAAEKAGIIKKQVPVVIAKDNRGIKTIIKIAKKLKAPIIYSHSTKIPLSLNGTFQKRNAALAVTTLEELKVPEKFIEKGLSKTIWPGRMQSIGEVIVDGAHNLPGTTALCKELKQIIEKKILIVGILIDKEYSKMLPLLLEQANYLILTKPKGSFRVTETQTLFDSLPLTKTPIIQTNSIKEALIKAKEIQMEIKVPSKIVICGSLYVAGEALEILKAPTF
jgi:dihydrofolate synthase/folylpolyglutamate synthase